MPAYMIVNVDVKDAVAYERYKAEVPVLIRKHGGEYLARGGPCEVLEGDWRPSRLVLFRFPDMESIRALNDDPDYQPLKALRHSAAYTELVAVAGI
ncbi:MAG TPA: DUF1330 domain-containing protein [Bryobacteraceae bacterium]|nr:DUF1330 domain-containing protein [Bryobacteraceae bacterium]